MLKEYIEKVKEKGLNMYVLIGLYKKRSRLKPQIPEAVLIEVCKEILAERKPITQPFPYFLEVLKRKTRAHFAQVNKDEHEALKKEPTNLNYIFSRLGTTK